MQPKRLLCVDDELAIGRIVKRAVERPGCTVLTATSAEEALKICAQHGGEFDLVLSDIVMPGMDGVELARELKKRWPDIKILLMSGYCEGPDEFSFIRKPFAIPALIRRIEEV